MLDVMSEVTVLNEDNTDEMVGYGHMAIYNGVMDDQRAATKFMKEIVSMIRRCPEYSRYRNYILENLDMDRCSILTNLSKEEVSEAGLEIHHYPLSLYDIVEMTLRQMMYSDVRITTFAVAHRVMAYHWKGMVGLVPLLKTLHEMAHADQLRIDPEMIYGNYGKFINENKNGMTEFIFNKLKYEMERWDDKDNTFINKQNLKVDLQQWNQLPVTTRDLLEAKQHGNPEDNNTTELPE